MAQPAPKIIDLSTLWSDGTGKTPETGCTQIHRGDERHTAWLNNVTRGFNGKAQAVTDHGRIQLTGDFPQGYTLWVTNTGGKPVEWLWGHPTLNFRSGSNFSDHVPELLAANAVREGDMRDWVGRENPRRATARIIQHNHTATVLIHPQDYVAAQHLGFAELDADTVIRRDRENNNHVVFSCSCIAR